MKAEFAKKLEEARTRQGISIRQASDALKIRSDFLLSFENDNGKFSMPDIYKHGFLKLYARYLKLDPEELTNEFLTYQKELGAKKPKKVLKEEREILGTMELSPSDPTHSEENDAQAILPLQNTEPLKAPTQNEQYAQKRAPAPKPKKEPREPLMLPETKALYTKIGLIFGGTLAIFTIFALVISSIFNGETNEINPNFDSYSSEIATASDSIFNDSLQTTAEALLEEITLSGDGDVHVVIRQESDKKRLFSGNISRNKPVKITRKGPVKIHFSNGSRLVIQKQNGKKVRPGREGVGWIEI